MLSEKARLRIGKLNSNHGNRYGSNPISKKVIQLDPTTKGKIKEWDSITRVYHGFGKDIVSGGISNSCKKASKGKLVKCMGYYWCYSEDYEKLKYANPRVSKREKPIIKLDKDTLELISEYSTLIEASEATNSCRYGISRVARGQNNICGGYKWMYKEDYEKIVTQ